MSDPEELIATTQLSTSTEQDAAGHTARVRQRQADTVQEDPYPSKRRSRTVINYSDKLAHGPRMPDLICAELEASGPTFSTGGEDGDNMEGIDLPTIALRLRGGLSEKGGKEGKASKRLDAPNFSAVRQSLIGLLRSGRARRMLQRVEPLRQPVPCVHAIYYWAYMSAPACIRISSME